MSTLSQLLDSGDFIAPDILSTVDANVRTVTAEVLERENLTADLEAGFYVVRVKAANTPGMADALITPITPIKSSEVDEMEIPSAPVTDAQPAETSEPGGVDIVMPDTEALRTEEVQNIETALANDVIVVEMPAMPPVNEDLQKIKRETFKYNKRTKDQVGHIMVIALIVIAEVILIMYLLSQ